MARNSGMVINKTLDVKMTELNEKMSELVDVLSRINENISKFGAAVEKVDEVDGKKVQQKPMAKKK